jgi:hypothetical protein
VKHEIAAVVSMNNVCHHCDDVCQVSAGEACVQIFTLEKFTVRRSWIVLVYALPMREMKTK